MQKKITKKKTKATKPVKTKNMSLLSTGVAAATGLTTTIGCLVKLNSLKKENKRLRALSEGKVVQPSLQPSDIQLKIENKKLILKINELQEQLAKKNEKTVTKVEKIKNLFSPVQNDSTLKQRLDQALNENTKITSDFKLCNAKLEECNNAYIQLQKEVERLKLKCKELQKPVADKIKEVFTGSSDEKQKLTILKAELEEEKKSNKILIEENKNLIKQLGDNKDSIKIQSNSGETLVKLQRELQVCRKEFEDFKKANTIVRTFTGKVRREQVI